MKNDIIRPLTTLGLLVVVLLAVHAQPTGVVPPPPHIDSAKMLIPADSTFTAPYSGPTIDTSKLFITEAPKDAFTITTFKLLVVGTWFEMRNIDPDEKGFKYAPEEVRVIVKNEPIVTAKDNGTWEITFKEKAP